MDEEMATTPTPSPTPASRSSGVKRRRISGSESPIGGASSPAAASTPGMHHQHHEEASLDHHDGPLSLVGHQQQAPPPPPPPPHSPVASSLAPQALTQAPPPPSSLHQHPLVHSDDLDIKPGIAELIREEERVSLIYYVSFPDVDNKSIYCLLRERNILSLNHRPRKISKDTSG